MAYTTPELVRGKSRLTNEPDFDAAPFIKEAEARIDARLRRRYMVPFADPAPAMIESIATNFAAGFAIERDYSQRPEKTEPYLAEVLIARAEADLQEVLDKCLLDGMENVEYAPAPPQASGRLAVLSTTSWPSEMEGALRRW